MLVGENYDKIFLSPAWTSRKGREEDTKVLRRRKGSSEVSEGNTNFDEGVKSNIRERLGFPSARGQSAHSAEAFCNLPAPTKLSDFLGTLSGQGRNEYL